MPTTTVSFNYGEDDRIQICIEKPIDTLGECSQSVIGRCGERRMHPGASIEGDVSTRQQSSGSVQFLMLRSVRAVGKSAIEFGCAAGAQMRDRESER